MSFKLLFIGIAALAGGAGATVSEFAEPDDVTWRYSSVGRTISIGDLHADPDAFIAILLHTGFITSDGRLTGPNRLIIVGDVPSRGPDSRFIFDLIQHLQDEARARFPRHPELIISILGNHEAMRSMGDEQWADDGQMRVENIGVRYPESSAFSYLDLIADRALPIARAALAYQSSDTFHLYSSHAPLDPLERLHEVSDYAYFRAFTSHQSPYAQTIRGLNTLVAEDRVLFVHAGIASWLSQNPSKSVEVINATVRQHLGEWIDYQSNLSPERPMRRWIMESAGPLWMRALANEEVHEEVLTSIMEKLEVNYIVIGHVRNHSGIIETRYGGKVFRTDTGISRYYRGGLSAMEFIPGQPPRAIDNIPRPEGVHPLRAVWESIFAARRAEASPVVKELHAVLAQIRENEENCTARLLDLEPEFELDE